MTDERGGGTTATYGVSDEVWRVIAPEGDRAAAHERRALRRVAGAVAGVTIAVTGLMLSGLVTARLSSGSSAGGGSDGDRTSFVEFTLQNDGVTPVHVVGWASPLDGVEVTGVEPRELRLGPRDSVEVKVSLRATDCAAAVASARRALKEEPMDGTGFRVVVDRPWGQVHTVVRPVMATEDLVLSSCGQDTTSGADGFG